MEWRDLLVLVHVLLLVYWLGTDLAVFHSARYVLDPELPARTRATVARILVTLDLAPRVSLVLTLPVGLTLAAGLGVSQLRGSALVAVWVASIAWLTLVLVLHFGRALGTLPTLRRVDLVVRVVLASVLAAVAAWSLLGAGPFATGWVSAKVLLYALTIACGIAIRLRLAPFGGALERLLSEGSSPELEAVLGRALRGTYAYVLTIWAALVVAAALGVVQP